MMYFLDTNALYWYYGRNKLNIPSTDKVDNIKLCAFLDSTSKKALATSAFIEAVVHFRNDPTRLKGLLGFLKEKKIKLYNNVVYYTLDNEEYSLILDSDETVLKSYSQKILKEKIYIESRFATAFLHIMTLLYLHHRLEEENVPNDVYTGLTNYIGKLPLDESEKRIRLELEIGYRDSNEKKRLKDIYLMLLEENYLFVNYLITIGLKYEDQSGDLVDEIQTFYGKYKNDKDNYYNSSSNQDNFLMERIKNELCLHSDFLSTAKPKIADMFSKWETKDGKKLYIKQQSRYTEEVMFDAWIDRGKKIDKNDIFDMLFIGCFSYVDKPQNVLEDSNTYLLSFDKTVKHFIGKTNEINGSKIDSFYLCT